MDRTTIYFVRHAESDVSVRDDLTRPLTARGEADALRVTTALKGLDIARVYSSPYKRAVDTVRDLAQTLGLEIITIDDLRERAVGGWVEDFVGFAKKQWSDFSFKLPGGESPGEVQVRNVAAVLKMAAENPGTSIVIGTHGTAVSTIINYFNPAFGFADFYSIIDKTSYILRCVFQGQVLPSIEEIGY